MYEKAIVTSGLMVCLSSWSISQDFAMLNTIREGIIKLGLNPYEVKNYSEIAGSPYLNPSMLEGSIITKNDNVLTGKLRYNIYTDEIEFEYKNTVMSFAQPDQFKEFYIENRKLVFMSYFDGRKVRQGFMIVNSEGSYSLFNKKTVVYKGQDSLQPYSTQKPDRFEAQKDDYYLTYKGDTLNKLISIRKLIKAYPDLKPNLQKYNQKVDFENLEEVKKMVEYINSQISAN